MLNFDKIESAESITRLIDISESAEDFSLQDRLAAIETLGATQSIWALNYLLFLWTNDGPDREVSRPLGGPEGAWATYYELAAPHFPNVRGEDLQYQLGNGIVEYRRLQLMNNEFVLDYRLDICGGHFNIAEKKLNFIRDDSQKYQMKQLHSELVQMKREGKDAEHAVKHYQAFYEILDSMYRKMLIKEGNAYLVLYSAIRTVATRLAKSGVEEAIAKLIDIVELGVKFLKPSKVRYRYEKGSHWWSTKKKIPDMVLTSEYYDLHDQLIAIEALGATRNEHVLNYLQKLLETKKVSMAHDPNYFQFVNARKTLKGELYIGLKSIDTFRHPNRGVFVDNAYLILTSAVKKLEEELLK